MKDYFCNLVAFGLLSLLATGSLAATGEGILSSEEAQSANPDTLLAEVAVFKSIREGITLSVALCESDNSCKTEASSGEVEQLLAALDQRIESVTQRQQNTEDTEGLGELLIAYVSERQGYSRFLDKLASIDHTSDNFFEIPAAVEEESAGGTEIESAEAVEQMDDVFADEDEEL